jgi:chemotaxis protein histidine kinase CheA
MAAGDVMRLLFAAGFSTREDVSEISGRGVGLDVVAAVVRRVGGEVAIESTPGEGTEITIEVPVVRRGELVTLVRVGHLRLALPAAAVKRAVRLWPGALADRDGRCVAACEDRLVPYVPLAEIYGQAGADRPLLLEGTAAGAPLAVVVDAVEGEEEVLVRPLPHAVGADRLLDGVALLASGEPVGVLSPAMLVEREATRARPAPRARAAGKPRVLLVDDSQVTREMERRLLEDAGFEVTAAGDAEEALQRLDEQGAHCLVVDVEMPGMDGFELTERLRASERFAQLPVVVVSTRSRPEDRLRGLEAGADAYLTKQNLDATELVGLLQRLVGR